MRLIVFILVIIFNLHLSAQQTIDATISHGGLTREYKLYVPASYNGNSSVPLLLNLHGRTSNSQDQLVYGDFRAIADTANFIMVLPQGTLDSQSETFWNAHFFGETVDDLGFISALIDTISSNYNINQDRIYSTGMSNGGFMSFMLACELSNKITAIASVTGSMIITQPSYCAANRPVPVMQIHGTADPTVIYNGSTGVMSIDDALNHWVGHNNCDISPTITNLPDISTSDNCTATRYDYTNGDLGSEVVHYKITGGEHTWPGTIYTFLGMTNQDLDASIEIWKFFSKYQMSDFVPVAEEVQEPDFKIISENPFKEQVSYTSNTKSKISISITDLTGKTIFQQQTASSGTIQLKNIPSGLYVLTTQIDGKIITKKIIKQ